MKAYVFSHKERNTVSDFALDRWDTSRSTIPGLSASECAVRCTLVSDCQGFSSAADTCVIFSGAQVALGGTWGYARCERKAAGPWSAATLLP